MFILKIQVDLGLTACLLPCDLAVQVGRAHDGSVVEGLKLPLVISDVVVTFRTVQCPESLQLQQSSDMVMMIVNMSSSLN